MKLADRPVSKKQTQRDEMYDSSKILQVVCSNPRELCLRRGEGKPDSSQLLDGKAQVVLL